MKAADNGLEKLFSKVDDKGLIAKYKHSEKVTIFEKSYPESLINKQIDLPDDLNSPKLRKKFNDHKEDFGLGEANFNKENAQLFKQRILDHVNDPDTKMIIGTYRGNEKVIHYFNKDTKINVMKDENGKFVSGWELGQKQLKNLVRNGNIQ